MIERSSPEVGYISPSIYDSIGVSQIVKVNGFIHMSGIVSASPDGSCIAPGDPVRQIERILEVLRLLLEHENLTMENLISTTVFTTDIDLVMENMNLFSQAFKEHPPISTWVEVKRLGHPDYLLEVVAIAAA